MKHWILSIAVCTTLAACGGGGGGGSSPSTDATSTTHPPAQSPQEIMASVGRGGSNHYVRINTTDTRFNRDSLSFPNAADIRKIRIEGVDVDLRGVRGATANNTWNIQIGQNINLGPGNPLPANIRQIAVSENSDNVVAGVLGFMDLPERTYRNYAFFNGRYTDPAQMPVSGKADYTVSAAYNKRLDNNQVLYTVTNTQTFTADFAAKTLTGSIRTRGNQTDEHFPIQARIEGNRFESAADAAQKTKGAFFGKNATEIGGVFQDVNTIGAFVGKQQ